MKHFVTLLVLALGIYFGWRYAPEAVRRVIRQFLGAHLPWVAFIAGLVFLALVGAFHSYSFNIL
jgi:hypothetical protein